MSVNLVLGVSGSVAAYRAADLARELMRNGFVVRVCLTRGGAKFVSPALFEALTGQPCLVDSFDEPERGRMAHIEWAHSADVLMVAPATANVLGKLANGVADDMLTTIGVAHPGVLVLAPAMNPAMYLSDSVQAAKRTLGPRAVIVEPEEGDVACGERGQGKLASIARMVEAAMCAARTSSLLKGKRVLVTSGPTQEPIDVARFISNRSSGKMGMALARAALMMGASVDLVTGPSAEPAPYGATVVRVRTALEMLAAASELAPKADWVVGAAAVADYRPQSPLAGKLRRSDEPTTLVLEPNPDVIAELAKLCPGRSVGFAAEPDADLGAAQAKLKRKGLFAIAANDVSEEGVGFGSDDNELSLLFFNGKRVQSGRQSKLGCALWLLERLVEFS